MKSGEIRYLIYGITMCIVYLLISNITNRDTALRKEQSKTQFVVQPPAGLKNIYLSMFVLGLIMFCTFLHFYIKGNPTVMKGHIYISLSLMAVGLAVVIWCKNWHITVHDENMEIYRLFHRTKSINVEQIEKAEIGKKNQISLYWDGKKQITIDALSDNYGLLLELLKGHTDVTT